MVAPSAIAAQWTCHAGAVRGTAGAGAGATATATAIAMAMTDMEAVAMIATAAAPRRAARHPAAMTVKTAIGAAQRHAADTRAPSLVALRFPL